MCCNILFGHVVEGGVLCPVKVSQPDDPIMRYWFGCCSIINTACRLQGLDIADS